MYAFGYEGGLGLKTKTRHIGGSLCEHLRLYVAAYLVASFSRIRADLPERSRR
ncbi:hypothetical protein C8J23_10335 [Shewanella chilikensis]|uniref:Transposase n=1 Tax=Shewanella chilikensis TaxID=558541 RepID=A0ABX5PRX0_9GAMM|nr:hypothetical protein C8J23_10335 [Shewanella chilikensis]